MINITQEHSCCMELEVLERVKYASNSQRSIEIGMSCEVECEPSAYRASLGIGESFGLMQRTPRAPNAASPRLQRSVAVEGQT